MDHEAQQIAAMPEVSAPPGTFHDSIAMKAPQLPPVEEACNLIETTLNHYEHLIGDVAKSIEALDERLARTLGAVQAPLAEVEPNSWGPTGDSPHAHRLTGFANEIARQNGRLETLVNVLNGLRTRVEL